MNKKQVKIFLSKNIYFIDFVECKRNSTKITKTNHIVISYKNDIYLTKKYIEFKFKNTRHSLSFKNLNGVKILQNKIYY